MDEPTSTLTEDVRAAQEAPEGLPDATEGEPNEPSAPRYNFGDPREASAKAALARESQRKNREAARPGDLIRYLRVPVNAAATVRRLASEAQRGSTHASRELRAWMDTLENDVPVTTSELDTKTRQRLLTRLLSELEAPEEEATQEP